MKILVLVLLALAGSAASAQSCPSQAPRPGSWIYESCGRTTHCALGATAQFTFGSYPYKLQSCDEVTWDFGDGSAPVTHIGSDVATHVYTAPGNYTLTVTVRNSLGVQLHTLPNVAAGPPATIEMTILSIQESQPSVTVPIRRTGDASQRVSATLEIRIAPRTRPITTAVGTFAVVFEPGETEKELTLPLAANDGLWDGKRSIDLDLSAPEGGALLKDGRVTVHDDEPRPSVEIDDVEVQEGDDGARLAIPVRLTGPLAHDMRFDADAFEGPATWPSDFDLDLDYRLVIPAGQTAGAFEKVLIHDDREPEGDEWFPLSVWVDWNYLTDPGSPPNGITHMVRITILDDDESHAVIASESALVVPRGGTRSVTLSLSPPHDVPVTVALSADASVLAVPATVTIPAGGSATFDARGVSRGATAIVVTPFDADVTGTAVDVEVMTMRRRAAR